MGTVRKRAPLPSFHPGGLPAVYAAPATGDCMAPLIPADVLLAFDTREPPQPGDVVALWFTPATARRIGVPGWVKRLVHPLPPAGFVGNVTVEMLNPPRVLTLRSDEVQAVHKCIGEAEGVAGGLAAVPALSLRAQPRALPPEAAEPAADPLWLEVFKRIHPTMIAHAVHDDRNAPLIRAGEIVVVESDGRAGWCPVDGGLFLIEYVSPPQVPHGRERRSREVVQTFRNGRGDWCAGSIRRGKSAGGVFYCADGPYRDEQHLADKLIGRVAGILAPTMEQAA